MNGPTYKIPKTWNKSKTELTNEIEKDLRNPFFYSYYDPNGNAK